MNDYIILMADIVDSRMNDQKELMKNFKKVTKEINYERKMVLLSPMTITLGDEFQGIVDNVQSAIELIFFIEEKILNQQAGFKLRYVLVEGAIDTPINKDIAYEMLGDGLTSARKALQDNKNNSRRYYFDLKDKPATTALGNSMLLYQSIVDDWKIIKDHRLITKFIELKDYKKVAEELRKTRSQIWKREKSLKMEEYFSVKSVINYIAEKYIS